MKSPSTVYKWRFYKKKSVSHYCVYKTSSCTCPSDPYKSNHILEKIPRISFTQMNDFPKVEKIHMKVIIQNVRCVISKRVRIYKIRWLALICSVINLRKNTSDFIHANEWFFQGEKIHKRLHSGEKRHGKRVRIYKIRWLALICCVINLRKITLDFIHADEWNSSQGNKK